VITIKSITKTLDYRDIFSTKYNLNLIISQHSPSSLSLLSFKLVTNIPFQREDQINKYQNQNKLSQIEPKRNCNDIALEVVIHLEQPTCLEQVTVF
jgi:hypothetical protein